MKKLIFILTFLTTSVFAFGQYQNHSAINHKHAEPHISTNSNSFFGSMAGHSTTTGSANSFFGMWAGTSNTTATQNNFIGFNAGYANTTGSSNNFIGAASGRYTTTGNNNVFIGYQAGYNETGSDKLYINNGAGGTGPLIYGDFSTGNVGINTTNATVPLTILGNGGTYVVGITQNQVGGSATMEFTTSDGISAQATRLLLRGNSPDGGIEFYRGKRGEEEMTMIIQGVRLCINSLYF